MRTTRACILAATAMVLVIPAPSLRAAEEDTASKQPASQALADILAGRFRWKASGPLISPAVRPADPYHAVKDPTVVFHDGKWHLFCTIRNRTGVRQIEYMAFADWSGANSAERHVLKLCDASVAAPQVFYFTPQQKWYLIYQTRDAQQRLYPAYSTTSNIADPASWTPQRPLGARPRSQEKWLDFWIICDDTKAHLFCTSLDGRMWRTDAALAGFPGGWSDLVVALKSDLFEASHTYRLKGLDQYLTIVEAQGDGGRYYQAYVADRLEGQWKGVATTVKQPFAGMANTLQDPHWTDSISHVELLRAGADQRLEVDPARLRVVFQSVSAEKYRGAYDAIPWRLGLLEALPAKAEPPGPQTILK